MWLKLLLCGLIIAFCILIGYLASEKYRSRGKFYAQMYDFNERYLNELAYARKPLGEFLRAYPYTGDFRSVVDACARREPFEGGLPFLSDDEKLACNDYFAMLGKGDSSSQIAFFSAKKGELAEKKGRAEQEAKSRRDLYLKLGLLGGLAFVILIL